MNYSGGIRRGDKALLRAAIAAYVRSTRSELPALAHSGTGTHEGLLYVVLRGGGGGLLAVYRVRGHDGLLKRLRRWPVEAAR